ncbi:MAG: T9SS type A sorting domain-containing protein [Chlorobi bacterium]|nr:T9SS type A sorting domain-containing protein [Chlorobiota bacterium]
MICSEPFQILTSFSLIQDGYGGAFLSWCDARPGLLVTDIYAQHLDANGKEYWQQDGVPVCTVRDNQFDPMLVPDGKGGIIVVWHDQRYGNADIMAQRLDADGKQQWDTSGVYVETFYVNGNFDAVSDGSGGVIVAYSQIYPDIPVRSRGIRAQRLNDKGEQLWPKYGVVLGVERLNQMYPQMISDNAGGAIVAWEDSRDADSLDHYNFDIYAQRINSSGQILWQKNGVPICLNPNPQRQMRMISDGHGGAIITWSDMRGSGGHADIYAQRIGKNGLTKWKQDGVPVCTADGSQAMPSIVSDGQGGAIICWEDERNKAERGTDIYAQRINSDGKILWAENGIKVCTAGKNQWYPEMVMSNGNAIVAWEDYRSDTSSVDIYASMITPNGWLKPVELSSFFAHAEEGGVRLQWKTASERNNYGFHVQRRESEEAPWHEVAFVPGHGTSMKPHEYSWFDGSATSLFYQYRLQQVDLTGEMEYSDVVDVYLSDNRSSFSMYQNYPNPVTNRTGYLTTIPYTLFKPGNVRWEIYDALGRVKIKGERKAEKAGRRVIRINLNGIDPGVYLYRLVTDHGTAVMKMVVGK